MGSLLREQQRAERKHRKSGTKVRLFSQLKYKANTWDGVAQRFAVIVTGWRSFIVGKAKLRNRLLRNRLEQIK